MARAKKKIKVELERRTKFWLVWNPRGNAPTFQHQTKQAAIDEAERLARQCYGQEFLVMESVTGRKIELPMDEIPF